MKRDKKFKARPNLNPYKVGESQPNSGRAFIDFNTQRVCPACGRAIKISHNFCKYCGVDLSAIEPIGNSDEISKALAITAVTDPDIEVRKEAVDTLGDFGETKVLGVLTFVLLNDPDEHVRKEACDELGDLHHPYSLEALAIALKDDSAIVRKEAIEGLKKIKKKNKTKKLDEGKPESKDKKEDEQVLEEKSEENDTEKG